MRIAKAQENQRIFIKKRESLFRAPPQNLLSYLFIQQDFLMPYQA